MSNTASNVIAFPKKRSNTVPVAIPIGVSEESVHSGVMNNNSLRGVQIYEGDFICYTDDFDESDFHPGELFVISIDGGTPWIRRIARATPTVIEVMDAATGAIERHNRASVEVIGRVFSIQRKIGRDAA